jgi:sporulation protein YlmC with PRC-barrel domain
MSTGYGQRGVIGPEGYPQGTSLPELERLRGMPVHAADGERIGTVEDVYVDAEGGYVRYLALDTGWFGGRLTVVPVEDVRVADKGRLALPYTITDLRAAPSYEIQDDLTISREVEVYRHYDLTPYWDIVRARQSTPAPTPEIAEAEALDPEMRTAADLRGEELDDVAARQTEPAPTPAIAEAEVEDAILRGEDPARVRVKRWGV